MRGHLINANCVRNSLLDALSVGWRLDLRKLQQCRRIYLRIGSQGSCTARIGSTIVSSNVTCEVAEPKYSRPSEGIVHFNLSFFTPVSVSDMRPQEYANEIRTLLHDSVLQSGSIDLESLCIVSGEKVWKINVNLTVLNSEGNVLDCASLAAVASLADFSLPFTSVEGRCMRVWNAFEKTQVPLVMNHYPLFTTFCLFHDGKTILVDPSEAEERLAESKLYIAVNARQEVCALKSVSKKRILPEELRSCIAIAEAHVHELTTLLSEKLELAKKNRKSPSVADEHGTFADLLDTNFDLPWIQLMEDSSEVKAEPKQNDNPWGMEVEDAGDASEDDTDAPVVAPTQSGETVVVEYSEFSKNAASNAEQPVTAKKQRLSEDNN